MSPSLFDVLKSDRGTLFVERVKTACAPPELTKSAAFRDAVRQAMSWGVQQARENKPELIGAAAGAVLGGGATLVTGKRWKKGKPSIMERESAEKLRQIAADEENMRREGKKPGFFHKMHSMEAKASNRFAKIVAQHPYIGSGAIAASSATKGAVLGRAVKSTVDAVREGMKKGKT